MRLALLAVLALFAGCVAPGAVKPASFDAPTSAIADVAARLYAEHDHADRSLHEAVTLGGELLNASTLTQDGKGLGAVGEIDAQNGLMVTTTDQSADQHTSRVVVLDATALPALKVLSTFEDPGAGLDVKLDPKQKLVYAAHGGSQQAFSIWDVTDPKKPTKLGFAPGPGCHMIHPQILDGESYVWCATLPSTTLYKIVRVPADGSATGVPTGIAIPQSDLDTPDHYETYYSPITNQGPALWLAPHDMTAQDDPMQKGHPLVVVANELQGIRVFDVSLQGPVKELAAWRGEGMKEPLERVHTAMLANVNGKRLGFGVTETYWNAKPSLYVVDFTDFAHPKFLGVWHPTGIPDDRGGVFTSHNFEIVGTHAYVSVWHAGVFVLDLADPARPKEIALRTPMHESVFPTKGAKLAAGSVSVFLDMDGVWDEVVVGGYTVLSDLPYGLEVVHFDGDPIEPAYTSFG